MLGPSPEAEHFRHQSGFSVNYMQLGKISFSLRKMLSEVHKKYTMCSTIISRFMTNFYFSSMCFVVEFSFCTKGVIIKKQIVKMLKRLLDLTARHLSQQPY